MLAIRRLLAQRHLAAALCVAVLLLKLLVPTGYMIGGEHGRISLTVCSGLALPSMHGGMPGHGQPTDHGVVEVPCAFAGLSAAALDTIDPIQLALPLAFAVTAALAWHAPPVIRGAARLRPPLRGPPARF